MSRTEEILEALANDPKGMWTFRPCRQHKGTRNHIPLDRICCTRRSLWTPERFIIPSQRDLCYLVSTTPTEGRWIVVPKMILFTEEAASKIGVSSLFHVVPGEWRLRLSTLGYDVDLYRPW